MIKRNGKLNRCMRLFRHILFAWLIVASSNALGAVSIQVVSKDLVKELNSQTSLIGLSIQVAPANFSEQTSGMQPLFSKKLSESLTAALAAQGAQVSLRETGKEPLRLIGVYSRGHKSLEIAVRLRKMTETAGVDIGAAESKLPIDRIDPKQLQHSLDNLAAKLTRQLEKTYLDVTTTRFNVVQPVPGIPGEPTLKLGSILKETLERALLRSEMFGSQTVVGGAARQIRVLSSYTVGKTEEPIRFTVSLVAEDGSALNQAAGQLEKTEIPGDLFEMMDDQKRDVCVSYDPADRRAVSVDSPTASELLAEISAALNGVGILPVVCDQLQNGIKIEASLRIRQKKLANGYGILIGTLSVQVLDNNKHLGVITDSKKQPFTGHANESRSALVEKFFTPDFKKQLVRQVLGWRP